MSGKGQPDVKFCGGGRLALRREDGVRYFTKEWYELCQERGHAFGTAKAAELQMRLDDISASFQQALKKENLPEDLWDRFCFHDGKIRNTQEGTDYIIEIDSPFSIYHRVTFRDAIVKQDSIPVGAVWLYEELYRHALGYEAHILSENGLNLQDTKIICSEILFEE